MSSRLPNVPGSATLCEHRFDQQQVVQRLVGRKKQAMVDKAITAADQAAYDYRPHQQENIWTRS
ncbi:hypothetical protein O9993_17560 [Vibrio lentus]|nr:hypothetical protein [Vibrio lentus]